MKKIKTFKNAILSTLIMVTVLFAAGFYSHDAQGENKPGVTGTGRDADDKVQYKSFSLGDSTLEMKCAPFNTVYVETFDSTGNGVDTFKVYLVHPSGAEKLAELKGENRGSDSAVYSTGIIINGDGGISTWKVLFDYPWTVKVVRSNAASLTSKVSKCSIRAVNDGTGSIDELIEKFALLRKPGTQTLGFRQPLKL